MLGSWLSSLVHKAAPVIAVGAGIATGSPAVGAAVYGATASKEDPNNVAPVVPAVKTTAVNPQGELILGGVAVLALILLTRQKPAPAAKAK